MSKETDKEVEEYFNDDTVNFYIEIGENGNPKFVKKESKENE